MYIVPLSFRVYITGAMDISVEAENLSALSSLHQLDHCLVDNSTLHDGALDGRADKCSISCYHRHRKRYLALHSTTIEDCKYICMYVHMYVYN